MNQFTCKGVKQINNRISLKIDIHLYHSYLSAFFVKAGVPNGEFPEILIAKCRSRIFGTWFFSQAEDFGSWREGRKGSSKSGEKCSRRKVHMYDVQGLKFSSPGLFVDDFLLARQIQVLAQAWRKLLCSPWKITFGLLVFCIFLVTVVLWWPSGPCSFHLLLVDLKNCVRLCRLMISRLSIFSGVTAVFSLLAGSRRISPSIAVFFRLFYFRQK
jgi:hypothetical protein